MRILHVISSYPPAYSYGGPLNVTHSLSKELVRRGHDVTVFTTDLYNARSRLSFQQNPTVMNGVKVYHFRNVSNYLAVHQKVVAAPTMALELSPFIESFDLVHLHEYFSLLTPLVHYYATKKNTPYVLQAHGSLQRTLPQPSSNRIVPSKNLPKKVFDILFGYSLINDASKIVASSIVECNQFKHVSVNFPLDRVARLPNYVDLETYEHLPPKGHFRTKYDIGEHEKIVLYVGRLHEIKSLDLLLIAFSKAKRMLGSPMSLVIVGPDEGYLRTLRSLAKAQGIENEVVFLGALYNRQKLAAYVDADVLVLASRYESFGNVALEALACGTPVIVTNTCGVSEWIGLDEGLVIEHDEGELHDALCVILQDESLGKKLGNNGRKLVKTEFGWEKGALRFEQLYSTLKRGAGQTNTS